MNSNFYDVMKKIIYFSIIVSLIFPPYSKCVNICYYDGVIWFIFDDVLLKRKILLKCYKNSVHLHGLQASLYSGIKYN